MSHEQIMAALEPFIDRFQSFIAADPALRSQVRDLAKALLALTEEPQPTEAPIEVQPVASLVPAAPPITAPILDPPAPALNTHNGKEAADPPPKPLLRPERPVQPPLRTVQPMAAWKPMPVTDEDLPLIAARCRLKAEGARWAAARERLLREDADFDTEIEPHDRDIIARAKMLPDCFLWMCHRDKPMPADLTLYDDLAGCFDAAAAIATLLSVLLKDTSEEDTDTFEQALDLAAEAQSSLHVAIASMDGNTDADQIKLFNWLRTTGAERQILIRHFMRRDDPANPKLAEQLQRRIQQIDDKLQSFKNRSKRHRSLNNKLRYHLKLITDNVGQNRIYDWQKAMETVEELVNEGLPPSNREIRDLFLPVLDDIPETLDLSKNFKLVLREIDLFLAARPTKVELSAVSSAPTEDVRRAAELLRGQTIVLIGGDRRPMAVEALTAAFDLKELIWVEGRDQTYADFEPQVARPDVAVVILAIRWSRHGFGEVKEFCEKYNKLLVRLPGGYSPNQLAFHIMSQVGDRLGKVIVMTEAR